MKEFTITEVSLKTKLTINQIRSRMKFREIKGKTLNNILLFNEAEVELISRKRNMIVDFNTENAIINRYLTTTENQIERICEYFQVSSVTVHRIINEHFTGGYLILESKMNDDPL